ncbi:MAG: hypothetical protein ABI960_04100, partial [Candidatus Eisenbacteria bacterium]
MSPWPALLTLAFRAPSPHNVQPWRVRQVDDHTIELFLEKARTLPEEDVTGSFLLLTMGLFLESLALLAANRGYAIEFERAHEAAWYRAEHLRTVELAMLPFATVRLRPDDAARSAFSDSTFAARRTSRLAYAPEPLPCDTEEQLARVAARFGHRFTTVRDPARIERLLEWNIAAVFEDLNQPGYHDELTSWFRPGARQARATRDGLDARSLHQPPIDVWLAAHAPWILRVPGLGRVFARRYRRQIGPVATLGILAGAFWEPEDAFQTGRALLHFWLTVTELGDYLHPYGNLVTNKGAAANVARETGVRDAWLVFKIGRSESAQFRLPFKDKAL